MAKTRNLHRAVIESDDRNPNNRLYAYYMPHNPTHDYFVINNAGLAWSTLNEDDVRCKIGAADPTGAESAWFSGVVAEIIDAVSFDLGSPVTDIDNIGPDALKIAQEWYWLTSPDPRYYSVTTDARMWKREIPAADVKRIYQGSETESTGYSRNVHEIIMSVEDDPEKGAWDDSQIKKHMYRVGDAWYSIPAAFESMTLNLIGEQDDA